MNKTSTHSRIGLLGIIGLVFSTAGVARGCVSDQPSSKRRVSKLSELGWGTDMSVLQADRHGRESRFYQFADIARQCVLALTLTVVHSVAYSQTVELKQYWNSASGSSTYFSSHKAAENDLRAAGGFNEFLKRRTHGSIINKNEIRSEYNIPNEPPEVGDWLYLKVFAPGGFATEAELIAWMESNIDPGDPECAGLTPQWTATTGKWVLLDNDELFGINFKEIKFGTIKWYIFSNTLQVCVEFTIPRNPRRERPVACRTPFATNFGAQACTLFGYGTVSERPVQACPLVRGNPCDAASGDKIIRETDYAGPGIEFKRVYHSATTSGDNRIGERWQHNYAGNLVFDTNGNVAGAVLDAGYQESFEQIGAGQTYIAHSGSGLQVRQNGAEWDMDYPSGNKRIFNSTGLLVRLESVSGQTTIITRDANGLIDYVTGPFGHTLDIVYDVNDYIEQIIDPAGQSIQFQYAVSAATSATILKRVTYQDGTFKEYEYELTDAVRDTHITGITDENGDRFATYSYDIDGLVVTSEHAGGKDHISLSYTGTTSQVIESGGSTTDYVFSSDPSGTRKVLSRTEAGSTKTFSYQTSTSDPQARPDEITDELGNTTKYTYDDYHKTSMTEAFGTTAQRTTDYEYLSDTDQRRTKVTTPSVFGSGNHEVIAAYNAAGLPNTITDQGYRADGTFIQRTTTMLYNASGQVTSVDGPRTDVTDVTALNYYDCTTGFECGQLQTVTNALGHVTSYDSYDAHGRLLQMTDANNLVTSYTYDLQGRVLTITLTPPSGPVRTITNTYDSAGQLKTVSTSDGMVLTYGYDAAHDLMTITDNFGNKIEYNYDNRGNRTDEDTFDPGLVLKRTVDYTFDALNRIDSINNAGFVTDLLFDHLGNLTNETDPKLAATQHNYDALNRLDDTIDALTGTTDYDYDVHDQLTFLAAANGAITTYEYDDLGNLLKEASPDRGQLTYTYDEAGNRKTELDARGKLTSYVYDALNRLTLVTFNGGQTIAYEYDTGAFAKGRLNKITDSSGQTDWQFDAFGAVTQKQQTIGAVVLTTGYGYDSNGRLSIMTLPSGKVVTYGYNVYQQNSVSVDGQTILSGASYDPFGPITGWTWGDGTVHARDYDLRGLTTSHSIGSDTRALAYDAAGNVVSQTDARQSLVFDYDLLERLVSAEPSGGGGGTGPLFSSPPVLLASIQTMKNEIGAVPSEPSAPWLTVATKNVTAIGAKVSLERGQVNTGSIDVKEKIGYLAIEVGSGGSFLDSGGNTITYEAQITPAVIKGWDTGCFETNFLNVYSSKPVVMASLNSHNGGDGGWLRRCSLNKTALGLTVDEDKFGDPERMHNNAESAGMIAFSAAFDGQFTDANGSWGMEVVKITLPSTATLPQFTNVAFRQAYATKPIVIVLPNKSGSNPASVRIRNVSKTGFEVTQVEPAPQNGTHNQMKIHYLAIEKGVHTLPDGTKLEAGRKATKKQKHGAGVVGNESWATVSFSGGAPTMMMTQAFAYDANGNRTSLTDDGTVYPYFYQLASNRLTSTTGPTAKTYTYDAAGNVINDGIHTYGYDDRGRLTSVDSGLVTYQHNGQGQRVTKDDGSQTLFAYDEAGMLIGEYDSLGTVIQETVYFNGSPVAALEGANEYYVQTDHLGTPRVVTDGNTVIWRWESDPFGTTAAQEDPDGDSTMFTYNLRFPGQYNDDETGLHYNYYRTFDPATGRYLESDPIGLGGGLNTYGYVGGNPVAFSDPTGEFRVRARRAYRGQEGAEEWMFWFEFTNSCLVEKLPTPSKWFNRLRKAVRALPDAYSGENDVPKSELCECRNLDPALEDFFTGKGYTASSIPAGTTQFNRTQAEKVLRELRKEFEGLVDEGCDSDDGCKNLRNAYPWNDLLNNAQERALPSIRDLR